MIETPAAARHDQVFHDLFIENPMPMWLFDTGTLRFVEVNAAAVAKYGFSRDEFLAMTIEDIRPKEDVGRLRDHMNGSPREKGGGYRRSPGWRHVLKDGSIIWVDIYSYDFAWGEHTVRLVQVHDMTDLRLASERLTMQSAYFRQLFDNSPEAIVMLDHHDRIAEANSAFGALFQYGMDELRGRAINELIVPDEKHQEASTMTITALGKATVERDTIRRRKDGKHIEVSALGYPITVDGQQVGVFAIYRDMTESKRIAAELAWHSTHDPLTGLINRHEFERRAAELVRRAGRSSKSHALLYMDVDQFKIVNDTFGHDAGDRLLLDLKDIILDHLRELDVLARLGGDEFGALLSPCDADEAVAVAQRIVNAVKQHRFEWDGKMARPGVSIGDGIERYEVLLRMIGADGALILPGLFIPAAERYGLMPAVDRRVMTRVFRRMAERRSDHGHVSVNLSGLSLTEQGFGEFIAEQLKRYGLAPQRVCFEITETSAVANLGRALSFIKGIRELGCSVALDDFGSGMSSFNYLKSMTVDYLKIDGSFIRDIVHNPLDAAMAEAITKVGKVKGIRTIAECVEGPDAMARLAEIGVDFAQGYHVHVPESWEAR